MQYEDMIVEASEVVRAQTEDKRRVGRFKVRVLESPAGETESEVPVEYEFRVLNGLLEKLESGPTRDDLLQLGRRLALLLLPSGVSGSPSDVRGLFQGSLNLVGQDRGLRLRLRLPPELAPIPWEYIYVDRAGGGDGMDGFVAIDPRVAIVRHEALAAPAPLPVATGTIKLIAALASNVELPELDLAKERANLEAALAGQPGIDPTYLQEATLDALQAAIPKAGIFHFAGHGAFRHELSGIANLAVSPSYLGFQDQMVDAETLGVNLRGNGVRLVVLGGCETGRRDREGGSVWGSVVTALVKAEIPAVIGNQYRIKDTSAIAFSKHFYQALAGGLPIEQAVTSGRIAVFNANKESRDWGVPVLYLRAKNGALFAGAPDLQARQQARQSAAANVNVRAREVAAGGYLAGAEVGQMLAGKLNVTMVIAGTVSGKAVGATIDQLGGGGANVTQDIGTVGQGGSVTGAKIDFLGLVDQHVGTNEGQLVGFSAGEGALRGALNADVGQDIGVIKDGGAVVGAIPGAEGPVHVGGQQSYGDTVYGPKTQVDTGGGAYVAGGVSTGGGNFVGRDKLVSGDEVRGDKIGRDRISVDAGGTLIITQGGTPAPVDRPQPTIEEAIRLDVAAPAKAVLNEPFDLAVAVRQPSAPALAVEELTQMTSEQGRVFRVKDDEIVKYRIEITGSGVSVTPPSYQLRLRPGENSRPYFFQITPTRSGRRSILVTAYQEDATVAAQTRVHIDVQVEVQP